MSKPLPSDVIAVLREGRCVDNRFVLPPRILPSHIFAGADKVLRERGGRYDPRRRAHVFPTYAASALADLIGDEILRRLSDALHAASEAGVLDNLAADVHPSWINRFCDAVDAAIAARQLAS